MLGSIKYWVEHDKRWKRTHNSYYFHSKKHCRDST